MVQADVRRLLIEAPLGLDEDQVLVLEAPVEGRPGLRRYIRKHLAESATGRQIDELVDNLLLSATSNA
jgi:hypothetical protein